MYSVLGELREEFDKVYLSIHWGLEQNFIPSPLQRRRAKRVLDRGVDILMGHHSHVFQPYERYGVKLIFYSVGNFQIAFKKYRDRQSIGNLVDLNTRSNEFRLYPIEIVDDNPILLCGEKYEGFYKEFDEHQIRRSRYYYDSLSFHYKQNLDSWKLRIANGDTLRQLFLFLRFHLNLNNVIGLLSFLVFHKILGLEYNPLKKIMRNENG